MKASLIKEALQELNTYKNTYTSKMIVNKFSWARPRPA